MSVPQLLNVTNILNVADAVGAEIPDNAGRNEEAEIWVRSRLAAGESADLIRNFPEKKQRFLSSEFIKDLLSEYSSDTDRAPRGIRVSNAIITGPLTMSRMTIPIEIELSYCDFEDDLIYSGSRFKETVSFEGSSMRNADFYNAVFEKTANFNKLMIADNANFSKTIFHNSANFSSTRARRLVFDNANFSNPGTEASFDGIKVGDIADISDTIFKGSVSFQNSDIRHLIANNAEFINPDGRAFFDNITVNDRAVFDQANFAGVVSFSGSTVRHFGAKFASFSNKEKGVFFNNLVVAGAANFHAANFAGPVSFVDAEIAGRLNMTGCKFTNKTKKVIFIGMTVGDSMYLNNAVFNGPVKFKGADIYLLEARHVNFTDPEGFTDFESMKIRDTANFDNAEFHGFVDFGDVEMWRLDANNVVFHNHVFADGMRVKGTVRFNGTEFFGHAFFDHTDVGGRLEALSATFNNDLRVLTFKGLRVRDKVVLNFSKFKSSVYFDGAEISFLEAHKVIFSNYLSFNGAEIKHFSAQGAQFKGEEAKFDGMRVADVADFESAEFYGAADFSALEAKRFKAKGIKFNNDQKEVLFEGLKVSDIADFNDARFEGSVSFNGSEIGRLNARRAQFNSPRAAASFAGMRVQGYAQFSEAKFGGHVFFMDAEIGGSLYASRLMCTNENAGLYFDRVRIDDAAEFNNAKFSGYVSFWGADIGLFRARELSFINSADKKGHSISANELILTNAISPEIQITGKNGSSLISLSKLDLTGLVAKVGLLIGRLKIRDLDASNLRVDGQISLEEVAIQSFMDFRNSRLAALNLKNIMLPMAALNLKNIELYSQEEKPRPLNLEGMKFQNMQVLPVPDPEGKTEDSRQLTYHNLKHMVDLSASTLFNLELLYESLGNRTYQQYADEMFFKRKRFELRDEDFLVQTLHGGWFLLAGYGRRPLFTFCWMMFFCIIGCFVFRRRQWMELQEPGKSSHRYNCAWYSFDLFLPFIDLQAASIWMPKDERKWSKFYMRMHRILGWALLPIFLATLTGITK